MVKEFLEYNQKFVAEKKYEQFITSKYPDKKTAILTCMDTRLTYLLPAALGLKNGDVKIIKNAGGTISHAFGSVMRSLIVAVYELGVNEIMVIGHTDCGVQNMDSNQLIEKMKQRGISEEKLEMIHYCGIHFDSWLNGFEDVHTSVKQTVLLIRNHPLIPSDVTITGHIMDSVTGELMEIK